MKRFKPIIIRNYTPLTDYEMKQIHGGNQDPESGSSEKKCKDEGTICWITFSRDPKYKNDPKDPPTPVPSMKMGTCQTTSGTTVGGSGASGPSQAICDCSVGENVLSGTTGLLASHDCQPKK